MSIERVAWPAAHPSLLTDAFHDAWRGGGWAEGGIGCMEIALEMGGTLSWPSPRAAKAFEMGRRLRRKEQSCRTCSGNGFQSFDCPDCGR